MSYFFRGLLRVPEPSSELRSCSMHTSNIANARIKGHSLSDFIDPKSVGKDYCVTPQHIAGHRLLNSWQTHSEIPLTCGIVGCEYLEFPWNFTLDVTMTMGLRCLAWKLPEANSIAPCSVFNMKIQGEDQLGLQSITSTCTFGSSNPNNLVPIVLFAQRQSSLNGIVPYD